MNKFKFSDDETIYKATFGKITFIYGTAFNNNSINVIYTYSYNRSCSIIAKGFYVLYNKIFIKQYPTSNSISSFEDFKLYCKNYYLKNNKRLPSLINKVYENFNKNELNQIEKNNKKISAYKKNIEKIKLKLEKSKSESDNINIGDFDLKELKDEIKTSLIIKDILE